MAKGELSRVFNCSMQEFYKIISDYEKYPSFLSEVKKCTIVEQDKDRKLVEYEVNVLKSFRYRLWMRENEPYEITWEFASGDLFKSSEGFWKLEDESGKTKATYFVEASFNMFVPGPVAKALLTVNLPNMMNSYEKRIGEIYGR